MLTKQFGIYVDRIKSGKHAGVAIYVGKGNLARVKNLIRNDKHRKLAKKYGIDRTIVFQTDIESVAYSEEKRLISELHTYYNDLKAHKHACNFTLGGEGSNLPKEHHPFTGGSVQRKMWQSMSDEERSQVISERNKKHWSSLSEDEYKVRCERAYRSTGYKHTTEAKEAIRRGNKGKKKPGTSKGLMGNSWCKGIKHTVEARKNMSESRKRWWAAKKAVNVTTN